MLAAGFDLPYVQDQVGHADPTTTLTIYAQVIRRPDRDQLRTEARAFFGEREAPTALGDSRRTRETDSWRGHQPPQREGLER